MNDSNNNNTLNQSGSQSINAIEEDENSNNKGER